MMKNDNTTSNQKVAIVTGASSGIGLGMTKTLLERGYRVVANSRNITKSKTLASSENLLLVDGDIGTKEIAVKVVDAAVQKFQSHTLNGYYGNPILSFHHVRRRRHS